ncbi:hypothetical protein BDR26DRAFT_858320 [Obelidium mucronatum]|nr:hypothetical protein BDR26DRAFT_858320 [Obelidium mucronatum]
MQVTGELIDTIQQTKSTKLVPHKFFVAWRGVLTLAFTGFPNELVALKQRIQNEFGSSLPIENSGSKWPKMTLGCLRDSAKPLTQEQVDQLNALCEQMNTNLALLEDDFAVSKISYVVFGCRSLEKVVVQADVELTHEDSSREIELNAVSEEQKEAVEAVLQESQEKEAYLKEIQKEGHREKHYTEDHAEATIAVFLGTNPDVVAVLTQFQTAVDFLLPGYYRWFKHEALHCTLRRA